MIAFWFTGVGFMLSIYTLLDGRNFGAGVLHYVVAKTPEERRQIIAAIGPLWTWHEVWLLGFGGTLIAAFPKLMAVSFAGYYLALFLILWCLLLRGMALEVGGHIDDPMWRGFWDFTFAVSSLLLAVLFGAAAGNLARGVPLDAQGNFTMAFFTDFTPYGHVGLLDWYTVSVALFAVVLLTAHGATYLTLKTEGPVHDRSEILARKLWKIVGPLLLVVSIETWAIRPDLVAGIAHPLAWVGLFAIAVAVVTLVTGLQRKREAKAFFGSNLLILGLLATGGAVIYPVMLHSTLAPGDSITAPSVASSSSSLFTATLWWPVALVMTTSYFLVISRRYAGKVGTQRDSQNY